MNELSKIRKSYKKTKIGWMPEEWESDHFGKLATFRNGINFLKSHSGFWYRLIGVTGFQDNISPKPESYEIIEIGSELSQDELLENGDLLFVRSNGNKNLIGRCLLIKNLSKPTTFSGFTIRARIISPFLSNIFVAQFFRTRTARNQINTLGGGTNISNLSQSILSNILIPIPPLPEQRKIAEILSTWDKAIELTEKLIAAKEQQKKGLMQRILKPNTRFLDYVDRDWVEVKLGEIFSQRTEVGFEHLPLLAITGAKGVVLRDTLERRDTSNVNKYKYLRILPGDIGYNTMRMWQGVSGVSSLEGIVSPAYTICIPTNKVDASFAGFLFKFPSTVHMFYRYSQGLVNDTLNLKFHNFSQIKVLIPENIDEQRKIAAILETCDREINVLKRKRKFFQSQKKGLMQQLLTGRIRVKIEKGAEL